MFLSKEDSTQLWDSVVSHDFSRFNPINQKLLNPQGVNLRHLPVRLYLPHKGGEEDGEVGRVRVVQSLVPAVAAGSSKSSFVSFVGLILFVDRGNVGMETDNWDRTAADGWDGVESDSAEFVSEQEKPATGAGGAAWCCVTAECECGGADSYGGVSGWLVAHRYCDDGLRPEWMKTGVVILEDLSLAFGYHMPPMILCTNPPSMYKASALWST